MIYTCILALGTTTLEEVFKCQHSIAANFIEILEIRLSHHTFPSTRCENNIKHDQQHATGTYWRRASSIWRSVVSAVSCFCASRCSGFYIQTKGKVGWKKLGEAYGKYDDNHTVHTVHTAFSLSCKIQYPVTISSIFISIALYNVWPNYNNFRNLPEV